MQAVTYWVYLFILGFILIGCAPTGRYYQHQDSAPEIIPESVSTKDAVPVYAPYAKANLRPYTIRGVNYKPMSTGKGYSYTGEASWYGQKFHGHLTSNGEIYDMYQMSAAHKTLPLPSYARVTNLKNGKQVVVKINDRGPFHGGRLVDLSYAAALKLDMLKTGVAQVKLDVIHVDEFGTVTIGKQPIIASNKNNIAGQNVYIQVAALQNKQQIHKLASGLKNLYQLPYKTHYEQNMYKLRLGPISDQATADNVLKQLKAKGYPGAYKIFTK